jgi:hypothetical protein
MKLLLSSLVILGSLILTQNSYGMSGTAAAVSSVVPPRAYSENFSVLACGKIVSNRLGDKINKGNITASNLTTIKTVK